MNKIVAIVGMCGSGKSIASDYYEARGYKKVYFGGVVLEEIKKLGLDVNPENEKYTRNKLRADYGMAAMAIMSLPKIEQYSKTGNVVIDGLYSWDELVVLKEKYPELVVIAIVVDKKIRYNRLATRDVRPFNNEDAMKRGTSSYLADTVIPMIPHKLSNGICSLNEGVIRLTLSCEMEIDHKGNVVNFDIFPSYIKSCKKMNYDDVNTILKTNNIPAGYEPYADTLEKMNDLSHILRKKMISKGYINFNIDEAKIICDENGRAIDIKRRVQDEGEELIECFMIAANETVASAIYNMDLPFVYRVHDNPDPKKIEEFLKLLGNFISSFKSYIFPSFPRIVT